MTTRATATFQITHWEQTPYHESAPALARAMVAKTFTGDLVGTSTAELLLCGGGESAAGGAGYLAHEYVTATLSGRSGTFVLQHGGLSGGGGEPASFGAVVPGTGTGGLEGLVGEARFQHDENGAVLTLDYDLPEA